MFYEEERDIWMEETVLFRFLKIRHPRPAAVWCWILTRLNGRKVMVEQMKKERARRLFLIAFVLFTFANGFGGSIISNYFKGVYQVDSVQRGLFFSARIMACSRPPPPTTRIFISVLLDSTTARDEKSPQASCFCV